MLLTTRPTVPCVPGNAQVVGARPRRVSVSARGPALAPAPPADSNTSDIELSQEASTSYLAYAMSVIVGRALPDVRDGLKPVHR